MNLVCLSVPSRIRLGSAVLQLERIRRSNVGRAEVSTGLGGLQSNSSTARSEMLKARERYFAKSLRVAGSDNTDSTRSAILSWRLR